MKRYVKRVIAEHPLPLQENVTFLHPEQVVVLFGGVGKNSVDVGSCCYLDRASTIQQANGKLRARDCEVNTNSFNPHRAKKIASLISLFSEKARLSGNAPYTLCSEAGNFVRFMDWADHAGYHECLDNESEARKALYAYIEHLREKIQQNKLTQNSANRYQNHAISILGDFLSIDTLWTGIRLIRRNENSTEPTIPPDEGRQSKALGLCTALFKGFASLVLDQKLYPYKLLLPIHMGYEESAAWIFPFKGRYLPPLRETEREKEKEPQWYWNYSQGRLSTFEEVALHYPDKHRAKESLRIGAQVLHEANATHRNEYRLKYAVLAYKAFVQLFMANTGMNFSDVTKLGWGNSYETEASGQGFRTIKSRAGGKPVNFRIEIVFLPMFRRYLELRTYLLNGNDCEFLFFSHLYDGSGKPGRLSPKAFKMFTETFKRIDRSFTPIGAREWRAGKSDFLLRKTDISTTAIVLQNSEKTVKNHYSEGLESVAVVEMGRFYERLGTVVLTKREERISSVLKSAIGECKQYGNPNALDDVPSIEPDCKQPEGCLFCDKYAVHADEEDIRKLFSFRFCIQSTAHLSASVEHFESTFGPVLKRVDDILLHIRERSSELGSLVDRVKREVYEQGELDGYWANKMEMLIEIGAING